MAGTFLTNAGALAANKRILADKTEARFRRAADTEARKMLFLAQSLSGGGLSSGQLRQMGHPYARRLPPGSAGQPDSLINRQSGAFAASWHARARRNAGDWTVSVWNTAYHARYLLGTDRMRERPVLAEVMRRTAPARAEAVRAVVKDALREHGGPPPPVAGSAFGALAYAVGVGVASAAGAVAEGLE